MEIHNEDEILPAPETEEKQQANPEKIQFSFEDVKDDQVKLQALLNQRTLEDLTTPNKILGAECSKRVFDCALTPCKRASISSIQLGLLSKKIISKWIPIHKSSIYEKRVPCEGGLNDIRLGPTARDMKCRTCGETNEFCIGHFGYIQLAKPVVNIEHIKQVDKILNSVCFFCSRALIHDFPKKRDELVLSTSSRSRLKAISLFSNNIETCGDPTKPYDPETAHLSGCAASQPQYVRCGSGSLDIKVLWPEDMNNPPTPPDAILDTTVIYRILNNISDEDTKLFGFDPELCHPRDLMITLLPVPPPCIRPSREHSEGDGTHGHDDATLKLQRIIKLNEQLVQALKREESLPMPAPAPVPATSLSDSPLDVKNEEKWEKVHIESTISQEQLDQEKAATEESKTNTSKKKPKNPRKAPRLPRRSQRQKVLQAKKKTLQHQQQCKKRKTTTTTTTVEDEDADDVDLDMDTAADLDVDLTVEDEKQPPKTITRPVKFNQQVQVQPNNNNNNRKRKRRTDVPSSQEIFQLLQEEIVTYVNNEVPGIKPSLHKTGQPTKSLRSRLGGKKGRLRNNLVGKRTDFSSRSVIVCDGTIPPYVVGLSIYMARIITIDEEVHTYNIHDLTSAVRNGPFRHPGANYVKRANGTTEDLRFCNTNKIQLSFGDRVLRHHRDGDPALMCRQPSLHRMNIMCHVSKIMNTKAFKMCYNVAPPYNLDFDGDEMSWYVPRNEMARAEALVLMSVQNQLFSPKNGLPVFGLVQDAVLAPWRFTERGMLFPVREAMMCLAQSPYTPHKSRQGEIVIRHRRTRERHVFWTGHRLVSHCLPDDVSLKLEEASVDEEARVFIRQGHLVYGQLTKKKLERLLHAVGKDCGFAQASQFIHEMQVVTTYGLTNLAGTVGIADCKHPCPKEANFMIDKALAWVDQNHSHQREETINDLLVGLQGKLTNMAIHKLNESRKTHRKRNGIVDVANGAGSKGSQINIVQIAVSVGQTYVRQNRILDGLPHFDKRQERDHQVALQQGFVRHSFQQGLDPPEYYPHAMGGREGLTDTAVKTSDTGYIERKLVKMLENLRIEQDGSVRGLDGKVFQLLYGDDNFDGSFVEEETLRTLELTTAELIQRYQVPPVSSQNTFVMTPEAFRRFCLQDQDKTIRETLDQQEWDLIQLQRDRMRHARLHSKWDHRNFHTRVDSVVPFRRLILRTWIKFGIDSRRDQSDLTFWEAFQMVQGCLKRLRDRKLLLTRPIHFSTVSGFEALIQDWFSSVSIVSGFRLTRIALNWALNEFEYYLKTGVIQPGEMIGPICAHSIGQSLTQMTLNTFHLAGSSSSLVMGIPRVKEIVNSTSGKKMMSSQMTIFLRHQHLVGERLFPSPYALAQQMAQSLPDTLFQDVVQSWSLIDHESQQPEPQEQESWLMQSLTLWQSLYEDSGASNTTWAPFSIRFVLRKNFCLERFLTPFKIVQCIQEQMFRGIHHQWLYSNVTDDNWIIRFRMDQSSSQFKHFQDKQLHQYETHLPLAFFYHVVAQKFLHEIHVHGVTDIKRATAREVTVIKIDPDTGGLVRGNEWIVETDGSNLHAILQFPEVDVSRTVCNDIVSMYKMLGIGAATNWIEEQIRQVLVFSGLNVNKRHLQILAIVMTHSGRVLPFNRHGVLKMNSSYWAQCSFETTAEILLHAAENGKEDHLIGVTENGIVGNMVPMGSGMNPIQILHSREVISDWERMIVTEVNRKRLRFRTIVTSSQPLDVWIDPVLALQPHRFQPNASFRAMVSATFLSNMHAKSIPGGITTTLMAPKRILHINGVHSSRETSVFTSSSSSSNNISASLQQTSICLDLISLPEIPHYHPSLLSRLPTIHDVKIHNVAFANVLQDLLEFMYSPSSSSSSSSQSSSDSTQAVSNNNFVAKGRFPQSLPFQPDTFRPSSPLWRCDIRQWSSDTQHLLQQLCTVCSIRESRPNQTTCSFCIQLQFLHMKQHPNTLSSSNHSITATTSTMRTTRQSCPVCQIRQCRGKQCKECRSQSKTKAQQKQQQYKSSGSILEFSDLLSQITPLAGTIPPLVLTTLPRHLSSSSLRPEIGVSVVTTQVPTYDPSEPWICPFSPTVTAGSPKYIPNSPAYKV